MLEYRYHSCRSRHCPKCQDERAQQCLVRTHPLLLPCEHYLLTLPQSLSPVAYAWRSSASRAYAERAAAVQTLADDRAWDGGALGILAVLHTWSRTLDYHQPARQLQRWG